ncbi:MAG: aldo/keto reductase [Candidatus Eisenbacteria bacterium]|nr:aldo/keto reductase [Candidatus Eisenbacteria bacterium]
MRKRPFGPTGVPVPLIGEGTWRIEQADRGEAVRAIRRALDLGMTHLDTAEMYGSGRAEEVIAEAIPGRRDEVFLVSKVLPSNATRDGVRRACEASLRRLRTDRLDCYLLHWPSSVPLRETLGAFEELRNEGKILSYGVSNFDARDVQEAVAIAGPGRIACNQVLYNLEQRGIEHELLPACRALGIAVVGYTPLGARHALGAKGEKDGASAGVLRRIGEAHGVTPAAVALAFLVREEPLFTIPMSANAAHVEENATAGDLVLSPEEIAEIDRAFPRGKKPRSLPTG